MTSRRHLLRPAAFVALLGVTGCSWALMRKPEDSYDGDTQPQCDDGRGLPVIDGILMTLGATNALLGATGTAIADEDRATAIIGGLVDFVVFGASMGTGLGWARSCREAKREYAETAEIERRALEARRRQEIRGTVAPPREQAATPPVTPRGFFCATSTSGPGFCVRDKDECVRTRSVASDLGDCTLTEKAWCSGDICFPSEDGCRGRFADAAAACVERE